MQRHHPHTGSGCGCGQPTPCKTPVSPSCGLPAVNCVLPKKDAKSNCSVLIITVVGAVIAALTFIFVYMWGYAMLLAYTAIFYPGGITWVGGLIFLLIASGVIIAILLLILFIAKCIDMKASSGETSSDGDSALPGFL